MPRVAISLEELSLGGGPKVALDLATQLTRHGHEVTVVTERAGVWWPELARRGLSGVVVRRAKLEPLVGHARRLAAFLNAGRFDAVVLIASWDNRSAHCATHLLDDRTAVVPVVQGDWPVLYRLVERDMGVWNAVVGCSPKVHAALQERFPDRPCHGIVNGIALPPAADLAARVGWSLPLRLLFTGRLVDSHKGILRLPRIVADCRRRGIDVRLTVIGEGPDGPALARACVAERVDDVVVLAGPLPPTDVGEAMRRHHVFVFPTNTEGMPLVVLEAQANGCVVVCTTLPGITDVAIEDGASGLLAGLPDDGLADRMAAAVASLVDEGRWRRLSAEGIDRSRRLFSLEAMGDAYAKLIDDLSAGDHHVARPNNATPERGSRRERLPCGWLDRLPPIVLPICVVRRVRDARHRLSTWLGGVPDGP
jgi:glycosyltransferase involved in cell wall biosynthesis